MFVSEMPGETETTQNTRQTRSTKRTNDPESVVSTPAKKPKKQNFKALANPFPNDSETVIATSYQNQQVKSEDSFSDDSTLAKYLQLNQGKVDHIIIDDSDEGESSNSLNVCGDKKEKEKDREDLGDSVKIYRDKKERGKDLGNKNDTLQQKKYPKQFQNFSNEFDIALWIANHERILNLAKTIQKAMSIPVNEEKPEILQTPMKPISSSHQMSSTSTTRSYSKIDKRIKYQLYEESKAIFLRTRNNSAALYEELVIHTCNLSKTDPQVGLLAKDIGGRYDRYRYKFHAGIIKLADVFKTTYESAIEPFDELDEFITDNVWQQLLQLHLKATDLRLKKDSDIIRNLGIFVRQVVKAVLIAQQNDEDTRIAIKKCDEYTINLKIPTKFGVAGLLPVQDLLYRI